MKSVGMRWIDKLRLRRRSLFVRASVEEELNEELRFHFDQVLAAELANGASPAEARRRARLLHGGADQIKEECRDARGVTWIENFLRDSIYAFRTMNKSRDFALTAICTIALGVGINTALYTVLYSMMVRPPPCAIRRLFEMFT